MSTHDGPAGALEELAFLARSANRVAVLDALRDGPVGRHDLEEATGVTRATLGRILDDFADRGWVREIDRDYDATQLGAYVSREFNAVLERFAAVPALNEVTQWFPEDGFDFDLGHLMDATVVSATRHDALAPTTHIRRRIQSADRVRLVTYAVLPGVLEACWRGTVDGHLELESVLEAGALEGAGTDPELVERSRQMAETGRAEVYLTDDEVPFTLFVVDDDVLLCLSGGEGAPLAVVETDDEVVRAWAEDAIDAHRRSGERLDASLFTG